MTKRINTTLTDAQYQAIRDAIARGAMDMAVSEEREDIRQLRNLGRACRKLFSGAWEPYECRGVG